MFCSTEIYSILNHEICLIFYLFFKSAILNERHPCGNDVTPLATHSNRVRSICKKNINNLARRRPVSGPGKSGRNDNHKSAEEIIALWYTLKVLIFAGTNFRAPPCAQILKFSRVKHKGDLKNQLAEEKKKVYSFSLMMAEVKAELAEQRNKVYQMEMASLQNQLSEEKKKVDSFALKLKDGSCTRYSATTETTKSDHKGKYSFFIFHFSFFIFHFSFFIFFFFSLRPLCFVVPKFILF